MRPTLNDIRQRQDMERHEHPVRSEREDAEHMLHIIAFYEQTLTMEDWRLSHHPERDRAHAREQIELFRTELARLGFVPVTMAAE